MYISNRIELKQSIHKGWRQQRLRPSTTEAKQSNKIDGVCVCICVSFERFIWALEWDEEQTTKVYPVLRAFVAVGKDTDEEYVLHENIALTREFKWEKYVIVYLVYQVLRGMGERFMCTGSKVLWRDTQHKVRTLYNVHAETQ